MKKWIVCFAVFNIAALSSSAQSSAFESDQHYVSIGYGVEAFSGRTFFNTYEVEDNFEVSGYGPFLLKYEYGVGPHFGLGLALGISTTTVQWNDKLNLTDNNGQTTDSLEVYYRYSFEKTTAVVRFNYHPLEAEHWDPYLGMGMGFKAGNWSFETNDEDAIQLEIVAIPVAFSASIGCRFLIAPNAGLFIETGIGHGYLQGGLQLKF